MAKKTFADKALKALYKGAKTTAAKARRLEALRKTGQSVKAGKISKSVKFALEAMGGSAKLGALTAAGAIGGAALAGGTAIVKKARQHSRETEKYQKAHTKRHKELISAIKKQRAKKK